VAVPARPRALRRGQRARRSPGSDAGRGEARRRQLLAAIVEASPLATVLFGEAGRIVFTNGAARALFFENAAVVGENFLGMLEQAPETLRRALISEKDELYTAEQEGEVETFYLAKRHFTFAGEPHTLISIQPVTAELARQEVATLKKVIRILGHEANNSLAPISSLMGSARGILDRPEHHGKLARIFATVEERAAHLQKFLGGYATLARLPAPERRIHAWPPFLAGLRALWPAVSFGDPPGEPGYFDAAQIQQVLINLIKNAAEAGGKPEDIRVEVIELADVGFRLTVSDRGPGMSDEVMRNAVLPFFTTKPSGSGLGLALCREIVEQHGGRLRLARRAEGGMAISLLLPGRAGPTALPPESRVRLSLTRA
jgi:two-component system nitrogen regulation sensor histidine kinase NtrY